jgi:hypothetical protein
MKHIKTFEGFLSKNLNEAEDSRSLEELEKAILKQMKVKESGNGDIKVGNEINLLYSKYKNKGGKKTKKELEAIAREANESAVSERFQGAGLQKFVDDTAEHCTDNGGNGENLLQYGLPELAAHIDAYYGPANSSLSDNIYTSSTVTAFKKFVVSMAADEIEHNQEEDDM